LIYSSKDPEKKYHSFYKITNQVFTTC